MRLPVVGGKGGLVCFEVLGGERMGSCEGREGEGRAAGCGDDVRLEGRG